MEGETQPDRPSEAAGSSELRRRLAELPPFQGMDQRLLDAVETAFTWIALPGGAILFQEGEASEALYVIVYGRLAVIVEEKTGERVIAHVGAGEVVGEMGLISGKPRSATLVALRDCELFRLDQGDFERLVRQHPEMLLHLARQLTKRLEVAHRRPAVSEAPSTVMIGPAAAGAPCRILAEGLVTALRALGETVLLLDAETAAGQQTEWFHAVEAAHDRILYVTELEDSTWTQRCFRQCDRILLVARGGEAPPAEPPIRPLLAGGLSRPLELVLVDETGEDRPRGAGAWLQRLPFELHCHVRLGSSGDLERLARLLVRRAVGIALSGGGARGFAHVGVIRALREGGVPLDIFGGTSMGAIIGAMAAVGWDDRQIAELVRASFAGNQPFSDYTVPVISLVRGRKVSKMLRGVFSDHRVEDTRYPYFCVSTNLTRGDVKIHRSGLVWEALRASVALPGLLPPMVLDGEVLVDGAMLDNFPSDVMSQLQRGPIVGCDVSRAVGLRSRADALDERSLWWLVTKGRRQAPGFMSILMSAATVSSTVQSQQCRLQADLLLEPPLDGVSMLDWQGHDRAMESGYRYAAEILERPESRRRLGLER